jgi:hypothetical protein
MGQPYCTETGLHVVCGPVHAHLKSCVGIQSPWHCARCYFSAISQTVVLVTAVCGFLSLHGLPSGAAGFQ